MAKVTIEVNEYDAPAIEAILLEIKKAREKHPIFPRIPESQLSILAEEFGEIAMDINDKKNYLHEVAQLACVCIRILENG